MVKVVMPDALTRFGDKPIEELNSIESLEDIRNYVRLERPSDSWIFASKGERNDVRVATGDRNGRAWARVHREPLSKASFSNETVHKGDKTSPKL